MTHVDDEDKKDAPIQGDLGGTQNMTIINESGLYSLILSSKLPTAKKIRSANGTFEITQAYYTGGKTANGGYGITQEELTAMWQRCCSTPIPQKQFATMSIRKIRIR